MILFVVSMNHEFTIVYFRITQTSSGLLTKIKVQYSCKYNCRKTLVIIKKYDNNNNFKYLLDIVACVFKNGFKSLIHRTLKFNLMLINYVYLISGPYPKLSIRLTLTHDTSLYVHHK